MKIFTKEQLAIIVPAINSTWQAVGSEVEQLCSEEGERLTNEAALECCLDAERVEMYGGSQRKEAQAILRKVFDDPKIGWNKVMKELKKTIHLT